MKKLLSILVICSLVLFVSGCDININSSDSDKEIEIKDNTKDDDVKKDDDNKKDDNKKDDINYDDKLVCYDDTLLETVEMYFENDKIVKLFLKYDLEDEEEAKTYYDIFKEYGEENYDVSLEGTQIIMEYLEDDFSEFFTDYSKAAIKKDVEEMGYDCK